MYVDNYNPGTVDKYTWRDWDWFLILCCCVFVMFAAYATFYFYGVAKEMSQPVNVKAVQVPVAPAPQKTEFQKIAEDLEHVSALSLSRKTFERHLSETSIGDIIANSGLCKYCNIGRVVQDDSSHIYTDNIFNVGETEKSRRNQYVGLLVFTAFFKDHKEACDSYPLDSSKKESAFCQERGRKIRVLLREKIPELKDLPL